MLDEGAGSRSALEIADEIDFLGADLATNSSFDASTVRLGVPVARLSQALSVMADVTLRPTFPDAELERVRQERLTDLLQARDDAATVAPMAFARQLFGPSHRYGTGAVGTATTIKDFTTSDLKSFHAAAYQPANATLIVVGDLTADSVMPQLEKQFGSWRAGSTAPGHTTVPMAPQPAQRQIVLVDMPGAEQSQVRIGWVGVPRSAPDYFPLQVLNTILGGSFTSRLNQNLREAHGYSYGASSRFDMRLSAGRRAGEGQELRRLRLPEQLRNDRRLLRPDRTTGRVRPSGFLLRGLREEHSGGHGGGGGQGGRDVYPAAAISRGRGWRPQSDRTRHPCAEPRNGTHDVCAGGVGRMSVALELAALMAYSEQERRKWRTWIEADPSRLSIPFQRGGRFPTVGALLDHMCLVERRHLARMQGGEVPDKTGVPQGDWQGLLSYADHARADLRTYLGGLTEQTAGQWMTFSVQSGTFTMTRRKLASHILLHEIRHLAQIAYAARLAGHEPPGEHDFFYAPETEAMD
jgi:uncharacterized damage-inducible protein DinB